MNYGANANDDFNRGYEQCQKETADKISQMELDYTELQIQAESMFRTLQQIKQAAILEIGL